MYSKEVLKRFKNPKHMGIIKDADAIGEAGNPICLPTNSEIQLNPVIAPIETVQVGAHVLSHDGEYNAVTKVFQRSYDGELINIKSGLGTVKVTPEHLIKAIKIPKLHKYLYIQKKREQLPAWHHASDLECGDILLYPKSKKIEDVETIKIEVPKYKYDFRSKKVPESIAVDGDFLRLAGYFIAEGDTAMKMCHVCLTLSFGSHETEYVSDTVALFKKIFGIEAKVKTTEHRHISVVYVSSCHITRFFNKLFGHGCTNKQIPEFMLFLPLEKQKELLKGLFRGDGFVNTKVPRAGYSTVSHKLAHQIKFLLIRQGIIPSLYIEPEKSVRGVNHRQSYRMNIGSWSARKLAKLLDEEICEKKLSNDSWEDENYIYVPIKSVSSERYSGYVHNLEVEKAHSYAANAALVHNCGDVMKVYIKLKGDVIKDIKFETFGCPSAISASDAMCELAKGKTLAEAEKITSKDIVNVLGELPPIKLHCSVLGMQTLKKAIENYKKH